MKLNLTQKMLDRRAVPAGRHDDAQTPTLRLVVSRTGAMSWIQRLMIGGRRRDIGLGSVFAVSLADARDTALRNRIASRRGETIETKRSQTTAAPTFASAEQATVAANRGAWKLSSLKSWQSTMRNHVLPRLGKLRVAVLTRADVIGCLAGIKSTSEAKKARQRIAAVLELALSREWATENVARTGNGVDAALPHLKRGAVKTVHHLAMAYADVPAFLAALPAGAAADCLRFVALTATRSGEARGAQWSEIAGDVWTIPADRMKGAHGEHRVPLSAPVLRILAERRGQHVRYVFGNDRTGRPLSHGAFERFMKDAPGTVHGFRTAFRTWAAETGQDRDLAEHALSHMVGNVVERSYQRADLLDRRRALMADWGAFLTR